METLAVHGVVRIAKVFALRLVAVRRVLRRVGGWQAIGEARDRRQALRLRGRGHCASFGSSEEVRWASRWRGGSSAEEVRSNISSLAAGASKH